MAEDCVLCTAAHSRKYGTHSGTGTGPMTCVPGYVVPVRQAGADAAPWYHEDELCWIGECEFCAIPMVVAKAHVAEVSAADRAAMVGRLGVVVAETYRYQPWFDAANLRIPDHFHVHARPLGRLFGHGMPRTPVAVS